MGTKNKSNLIAILENRSNELTNLVRMDVLKELNTLLYNTDTVGSIDTEFLEKSEISIGSVKGEETDGPVLNRKECLDMMRVLEKMRRKQNMQYNDLFDRFKKQLMGTFANAVV